MKSFTLSLVFSMIASGCIVSPYDNENVSDVFGHTGSTLRMGSVYIGPSLELDDESIVDIVSDCDSERYECEIDESAE